MAKIAPVTKVSKELLGLLNDAIARELQVVVQYMWQHVQWSGVKGFAVKDSLQSIAIEEMKHAEAIAERLFYFDGTPTTKPTPIFVGNTLKEMMEQNVKDEEGAIVLYKKIIAKATADGDESTVLMFEGILKQEEDHHDTFSTLLEDL